MKTLTTLKKDLEFNRNLSSLIEALKTIAVTQYRILEQKLKTYEKLILAIESFFQGIDITKIDHPFLNPPNKTLGVVAVTSDSGLLGGLNMQVMAKAFAELKNTPGKLIVIGERGKSYIGGSEIPFVSFPGIRDEDRYEQAVQLRDYIIDKIIKGSFSCLKVVYPKPISFTVQRVEIVSLLPFVPSIKPSPEASGLAKEFILESRIENIVEYLIYLSLAQKFYEIFGLSRLAEFAARYVHLEESLQKLKEMEGKIRRQYFRVRHELIDCNMRELFSARLAYFH
jgi:ATP synthase F1 gamma subunit